MKIERIIKKDDKKVFLILENEERILLSKDIVYKSGLRKNDKISEDLIKKLLEDEKKLNIKHKALSFLKRRLHSRKELFIKLRRHFSEVKLIEECLSDLSEKKFIDDEHFAAMFVQEKLRLKKWSKSKLTSELLLKGIDKQTIENCLNKLFDTELEKDKAFELLQKKFNSIQSKTNDKKIMYRKLMMFLQSKGYDYQLSSELIGKVLKVNEDEFNL